MITKFKATAMLAFICLAVLFNTSCKNTAPSDGYIIKGKVKGLDTGMVKMVNPNYTDWNKARIIDSVQMQNGTFEFKGKVDHIDMVSIRINSKYDSRFFLENNPMTVELDLTQANERGGSFIVPLVSGSKHHDIFALQEAKLDSIMNQEKYAPLVALRAEMEKAYKSKDEEQIKNYKEKSAALSKMQEERFGEYRNSKLQYAKENPGSPVAIYVLGYQFSEGRMSKDELKEYYHLFQGDAKNTGMYKYYTKIYTEIFESLGVGAKAPDFTLTALNGSKLKLSEVEAKYILLDFWASWCGPCRASFPHLKEVYKKYHKNGFEVVGIGTADEEAKWRKAIEEDNIPWNHVFDNNPDSEGKAFYGPVAKLYSVPFLPTTFLIDGNMTILGRQLRGDELDAKLEELFGY